MSITIVCGPPCAGKTTWVQQHAAPEDLIVDYDLIAQSLGSPVTHRHHHQLHRPVEAVISGHYDEIRSGHVETAWVVRSLPEHRDRQDLADYLGADVVLIDAPDDELRTRAQRRPDTAGTLAAIADWRHRETASRTVSPLRTKGNWSAEGRKLPGNWTTLARQVLREEPTCRIASTDTWLTQRGYVTCTGASTEVDHVNDNEDHGRHNLRGVCHNCHARRTQIQAKSARTAQLGRASYPAALPPCLR